MKNLPEDNMVDELRKRLANYTEDPDDDDWDKIAAVIHKGNSSMWLKYAAIGLIFFLYTSLVWLAGKHSSDEKDTFRLVKQGDLIPLEADSCQITRDESGQLKTDGNAEPAQLKNVLPKQTATLSSLIDTVRHKKNLHKDLFVKVLARDISRAVSGMIKENYKVSMLPSSSHLLKNDSVSLSDSVRPPKDSLIEKTDTVIVKEEVKKAKENRKRLSPTIYFMMTPSLAFQKIVPSRHDEILITKLNSKGILSSKRIGIAADIGLQWQLKKKMTLYSGISYYKQDASVSYSFQSQNVKEVDASGEQFSYLLSPGVSSTTYSYKMKNIGVSAGFLYHLQGVKLQHKIGAGLQYQVGLLQENGNRSFENKGSDYLNYQVLYRMEFSMHPKYHFYVQPGFTHLILSHEKMYEPIEVKPYRAGISFGVVYFF